MAVSPINPTVKVPRVSRGRGFGMRYSIFKSPFSWEPSLRAGMELASAEDLRPALQAQFEITDATKLWAPTRAEVLLVLCLQQS